MGPLECCNQDRKLVKTHEWTQYLEPLFVEKLKDFRILSWKKTWRDPKIPIFLGNSLPGNSNT